MVAKVKRCTISRHLFVYVSEEKTNIEKIKNHFIFIRTDLLFFFLHCLQCVNTLCDIEMLWYIIYEHINELYHFYPKVTLD